MTHVRTRALTKLTKSFAALTAPVVAGCAEPALRVVRCAVPALWVVGHVDPALWVVQTLRCGLCVTLRAVQILQRSSHLVWEEGVLLLRDGVQEGEKQHVVERTQLLAHRYECTL